MTMWAETQTHRFAAAVAGAGLSDWMSYYGLNDIDEWMIPFFGASVYDDPAVYAKSDPMHFVKAVKTPTLILVGDRDGEVPMEQSVEWWHALKTLKVPTRLVVYADEGHAILKPADARGRAMFYQIAHTEDDMAARRGAVAALLVDARKRGAFQASALLLGAVLSGITIDGSTSDFDADAARILLVAGTSDNALPWVVAAQSKPASDDFFRLSTDFLSVYRYILKDLRETGSA